MFSHSPFPRPTKSAVLRLIAVVLVALACSTAALSGELRDAAKIGGLAVKGNPHIATRTNMWKASVRVIPIASLQIYAESNWLSSDWLADLPPAVRFAVLGAALGLAVGLALELFSRFLSLLAKGRRPKMGFLSWALNGGIYFGQEAGSTLGSIGLGFIAAGAIPALRNGGPDAQGLFIGCLVLGCIGMAAGYGQYMFDSGVFHFTGGTSLHVAAEQGQLQRVERLLSKGAEINALDGNGNAPLHLAVIYGHPEVAMLLVRSGADVHAKQKNKMGGTPLFWAAQNGYKDLVALILEKSPGNGLECEDAWAVLSLAASAGHRDVVELLLSKGASANAKDNEGLGMTPLHFVARYGRGESGKVVELLLNKGAQINARDNQGRTPLSCAMQEGNKETAEVLRRLGAE
jgi:ankyrin repeat protein